MKARPTSLVLLLTSENLKFFSLFKGFCVMFRLSIDISRSTAKECYDYMKDSRWFDEGEKRQNSFKVQ